MLQGPDADTTHRDTRGYPVVQITRCPKSKTFRIFPAFSGGIEDSQKIDLTFGLVRV